MPQGYGFLYTSGMKRNFCAPVARNLAAPEVQRNSPTILDINGVSRATEAVGGVHAACGGTGYHGQVAFNETSHSPWHAVSPEQFRTSTTSLLNLTDDTKVALKPALRRRLLARDFLNGHHTAHERHPHSLAHTPDLGHESLERRDDPLSGLRSGVHSVSGYFSEAL